MLEQQATLSRHSVPVWLTTSRIDPHYSSNTDLVESIRSGDPLMEHELVRRFQSSVYSVLTRLVGDSGRAEDLTHETLITVLVRLRNKGIDNPDGLSGFIHQTARYLFIAWKRRAEQKLVSCSEFIESYEMAEPAVDEAIYQEKRILMIRKLISRVKVERDRELLTRFYVQEESRELICEALDLSHIHFSRVICRARTRIREMLESEPEQFAELLPESR